MIDRNWSQSVVHELYVVCYFCKQQTIESRERKYEPGHVVTCANVECGNEIRLGNKLDKEINYGKKKVGKIAGFFKRVRTAIYRKFFASYE